MRAFQSGKEFTKIYKQLRKLPEITGIDENLHWIIKNGKREYFIMVYVTKLTERVKNFSFAVNGYPIRFKVTGPISSRGLGIIPSFGANINRERPVIAGISGCHAECTACTISGFFQEEETLLNLVASNEHCFGLEGKAKIGDLLLQPSRLDEGEIPQDVIGKFYKHIPIQFEIFTCPFRRFFTTFKRIFTRKGLEMNKVDISFGTLEVDFIPKAMSIGFFSGKSLPKIGEQVQKSGRTTGHTMNGKVISTSWTGIVGYSRGRATFTDCILIEGNNFSAPGDSGSPVFDMKGNLIGILFAGSDSHTVVCKIFNIEKEGKVKLITI